MGCGMFQVFKAGSGCGLNVDGIFISLTFGRWIAVNIKKKRKPNQTKRASAVHFLKSMRLMVSCRLKVCSSTHKWNAARQPTFSLRWWLPVSFFCPPATELCGVINWDQLTSGSLIGKNSGGDHLLISCLFVHASCFLCPKDSALSWGDYFIMSVLQALTKR